MAKEETALATKSETALAKPTEVPVGMENVDPGDIKVPRISVVQHMSLTGTVGTFRSSLFGDEHKEMKITPIIFWKGMVLFDKDNLGSPPLCRSDNALKPSPMIEDPVNEICHVKKQRLVPVCENAKWVERTPPKCNLTYKFIMINTEGEVPDPFFFSLKGTSIKSGQSLVTYAWQKRRSLFDVSCKMSLSEVVTDKTKYYVVNFSDFELLEPNTHLAIFEEFRGYEERMGEMEQGGDGDDPPF